MRALFTAASIIVCASYPTAAVAQETSRQQVEIASQPLAQALGEIARRYGIEFVAPDELTRGKTAPAVSGALTADQALNRVLAGSDLQVNPSAGGTFIIAQQTAQAEPLRPAAAVELSAEPEEPLVADTIIVTGTKMNIGVQDTVESVEVFTAERLDRENLFDLGDALARTPNVSIIGDNLDRINIRGINRQGTTDVGEGLAINVFLDGVPLGNEALQFGSSSAWDIEQVEVLRGSQSTVQGRNSIGGAIVLQSRQPTFDWETVARVRYAEFGTVQTAGAVSGPLIADQLAFRLSVDYQETDGFIKDGLSTDTLGSLESLTVRARFLIEPAAISGLSALLTVEYNDRHSVGTSHTLESERGDLDFDPRALTSFRESIDVSDFETWKFIADITYEFSDSVTLKLLGTYEDITAVSDVSDRTVNRFAELGVVFDNFQDTYSAEARLEFDFRKLTGFVGGYYFSNNVNSIGARFTPTSGFLPFPVTPADSVFRQSFTSTSDAENFAFFTSWRYEPSDNWTFDVALRYDDESFSSQSGGSTVEGLPENSIASLPGFLVGLPTVPVVQLPLQDVLDIAFSQNVGPIQENSSGVLLPSGSITYHITEDASVFVGYRRGYRAGAAYLANTGSLTDRFQILTYEPEFLDTFEAGWRTQWLDGRLTVNGTLFYSEYEDQQIRFTNEEGQARFTNAGQTSLYGLELSINFQATPALSLFASLGLLETNVDEFLFREDQLDSPESDVLDLAGNDLERSPTVSFNFSANYQSQSGFFAGASVNYQSAYFSDIFNLDEAILGNGLTERVGAAAIVNAQIGYTFNDTVTITVYANNLFDERSPELIDIGSAAAARGVDDLTDNVLRFNVRQPQTFGVTIDARF